MRFVPILLITAAFGAFYFYQLPAICSVPYTYRLGELDERFGLSQEEARAILARAETVWEGPLGRELFVYDEESSFPVNFIYDSRQAFAEAEYGFREELDSAREVSAEVRERYESLLAEYEVQKERYDRQVRDFERRLSAYNASVASYNASGGAPPDAFAELEAEKKYLDSEERAISRLAQSLNSLVDEINEVGETGQLLVRQYNEDVGTYNRTFGEARQFTQGDYRGQEINVYTFSDRDELTLVLAHEFGHMLGIDHVEGRESIMYNLIGEQPRNLALSSSDNQAFVETCEAKSWQDRIGDKVRSYFN